MAQITPAKAILLSLPLDLLLILPNHLHNIEDHMNLSSTCRTIRNALSKTHPNTILRLAAASQRTFFRPDPYFLIAATVRQVSNWALLSSSNTEILRTAFKNGINALLELCVEKAGLTMEEIRKLHLMRFSTFNPVADFIDRLAGNQWYSTPNFWDGGVSDAVTIDCEPTRAMFQIIIYGELFSSTMASCLEPEKSLPKFDIYTRLDFIRYCIPEWICAKGSPGLGVPEKIGQYAEGAPHLDADQIALQHVLNTRRWRESWKSVRRQVGGEFTIPNVNMNSDYTGGYEEVVPIVGPGNHDLYETWRQHIWDSAVQCQGLGGLEMLRPGGVEKWKGRLEEIRGQVEKLESKPKGFTFGRRKNPASEYPCLADEVFICMAGYWQYNDW